MKPEELQDALNYIDDELIEETNLRRQKKSRKRYWITYIATGVTAASLIVFLVTFFIGFNNNTYEFLNIQVQNGDVLADDKQDASEDLNDDNKSTKSPVVTIDPENIGSISTKGPVATTEPDGGYEGPMDGENYYPDEAPGNAPEMSAAPTHSPVMDGDGSYYPNYSIQPSITRRYTVVVTVNYVSPLRINCKVIDGGNIYGLEAGENIDIYLSGDTVIDDPDIFYIKTRLRVTMKFTGDAEFVATEIERWEG